MTRRPQSHARRVVRRGFTLMEVLLVLAILGVIGALVIPNLLGSQQNANIKAAKNDIKRIEGVVEIYAINNNGTPPESLQKLAEPFEKDGVKTDPLLETIPNDPWGKPYNYKYGDGTHSSISTKPDIWSNGPNGTNENGSGDDIANWTKEK